MSALGLALTGDARAETVLAGAVEREGGDARFRSLCEAAIAENRRVRKAGLRGCLGILPSPGWLTSSQPLPLVGHMLRACSLLS